MYLLQAKFDLWLNLFNVQYSPKITHVQELLFTPASWKLCQLPAGHLCLNSARHKNFFCCQKFKTKEFFCSGIYKPQQTLCGKSTPAKTVQRSLQNQGAYFYRVKVLRSFYSLSCFYFHRQISFKILQTKFFNRSDQGQARHFAQHLNHLHYHLVDFFSFALFLSFLTVFVYFASLSGHLTMSLIWQMIIV